MVLRRRPRWHGQITGVLNIATETSAKVLAERRADMSARLVATWPTPRMPRTCVAAALDVLGSHNHDHLESDLRWAARAEPAPAAVDDEGRGPRRARRRAGRSSSPPRTCC